MDVIRDVASHAGLIRSRIAALGSMGEHNFEYWLSLTDEGTPLFLYDETSACLAYEGKEGMSRILRMTAEPMTAGDPVQSLVQLVEFAFSQGYDKMVLEARQEVKKGLIEALKGKPYRVLKERYHMMSPVYDLKSFDENLQGGEWKKLRYFKNKFFKEHKVEVIDAADADKEELKVLVMGWVKKRTAHDKAYYRRYLNMIDNGFKGFDMAKAVKADGRCVAMFGGWRIPNSSTHYSSLGIYDYDVENIGEVANVLDLIHSKRTGLEKADWAGGEDELTNFKKKFHPIYLFRTDLFAVVRH